LKQTHCFSSNFTMPALSLKTLTHQSFAPSRSRIVRVAAKIVSLSMLPNCTSRDSSR
jgi:hypothetical protein